MTCLFPTILAAANPVDHVTDKPILVGDWGLGEGWIISNVTVMLVLAGVVTLAILIPAARKIATGERKTLDDFRAQGMMANLVEIICISLRDTVFKPVLKDQTDKHSPILWTFFWFILICNLLGLVPLVDITAAAGQIVGFRWPGQEQFHGVGGTATQSIWVTAGLTLIAFFYYNLAGLIKDPVGYFKHLTGGAPVFMWPIMIPVEILGIFVKPFALLMRLFANMTGGHVVIAAMLSFVYMLIKGLGPVGYGLAIFPILGATGIYFLEILVCFIQAFVFTFLVTLFLGQLVVHDHGHHDHGHDEHASHEHAKAAH